MVSIWSDASQKYCTCKVFVPLCHQSVFRTFTNITQTTFAKLWNSLFTALCDCTCRHNPGFKWDRHHILTLRRWFYTLYTVETVHYRELYSPKLYWSVIQHSRTYYLASFAGSTYFGVGLLLSFPIKTRKKKTFFERKLFWTSQGRSQ